MNVNKVQSPAEIDALQFSYSIKFLALKVEFGHYAGRLYSKILTSKHLSLAEKSINKYASEALHKDKALIISNFKDFGRQLTNALITRINNLDREAFFVAQELIKIQNRIPLILNDIGNLKACLDQANIQLPKLPSDLIKYIFSMCGVQELGRAEQVSHSFLSAIDSKVLWKNQCKQKFSKSNICKFNLNASVQISEENIEKVWEKFSNNNIFSWKKCYKTYFDYLRYFPGSIPFKMHDFAHRVTIREHRLAEIQNVFTSIRSAAKNYILKIKPKNITGYHIKQIIQSLTPINLEKYKMTIKSSDITPYPKIFYCEEEENFDINSEKNCLRNRINIIGNGGRVFIEFREAKPNRDLIYFCFNLSIPTLENNPN